jgi:hypothetical protein
LGVTILAEDDVGNQHPFGVEHDQRMTGQGPSADETQRLDPMLGPGQMTSVENPNAISLEPRIDAATDLINDIAESCGRMSYQSGAGARLDPVDLVVNRLPCDTQARGHLFEGRVDRRPNPTNNEAHQIDNVREQEVPRVLQLRMLFKQGVDRSRRQGVLQERLNHDAHRRILDEPLNDVG